MFSTYALVISYFTSAICSWCSMDERFLMWVSYVQNKLSPWSRVLLEKPIVPQLVNVHLLEPDIFQ